MSSVAFKFDYRKFKNLVYSKHEKVIKNVLVELAQEQLTRPLRTYPNTTKRKNGQIVSSPRDVVDTRELVNSLEVTEKRGWLRSSVKLRYTAGHAGHIYEGTDKQPAYPWIDLALRRINYEAEFDKS